MAVQVCMQKPPTFSISSTCVWKYHGVMPPSALTGTPSSPPHHLQHDSNHIQYNVTAFENPPYGGYEQPECSPNTVSTPASFCNRLTHYSSNTPAIEPVVANSSNSSPNSWFQPPVTSRYSPHTINTPPVPVSQQYSHPTLSNNWTAMDPNNSPNSTSSLLQPQSSPVSSDPLHSMSNQESSSTQSLVSSLTQPLVSAPDLSYLASLETPSTSGSLPLSMSHPPQQAGISLTPGSTPFSVIQHHCSTAIHPEHQTKEDKKKQQLW